MWQTLSFRWKVGTLCLFLKKSNEHIAAHAIVALSHAP